MNEIQLTNTLGHKKQLFKPLVKGKVSFYHCGPTVYWTQQIGNMFAMTHADFIRRSFQYMGYEVLFVRNYTDVGHLTGDNDGDADTGEDRMEKASKRESKSPLEIAQHYIDEFDIHLEMLNILPPDHAPRATEYIEEMITLVSELLDQGFAYQTELAIYFDTSKKESYYKLSGQNPDDLRSGSGHGSVSDQNKKNNVDFAMWFFKVGTHEHALQTWVNPFSQKEGFPGWHIECSAMIRKIMGISIDLHMGGVEHIPIHHTNEIAQSECANNAPLAMYWLHNEHLLIDGIKMSKSTGTAFTVNDLIEKGFDPLDLRYFFLQANYRTRQNFTWDALNASATARKRLWARVQRLPEGGKVDNTHKEIFIKNLADDINIPGALAVVSKVLKSDLSEAGKKATILDFDKVLGLKLDEVDSKIVGEVPENITVLLEQRKQARKDKNWTLTDELRDQIYTYGYTVKDTPEGQIIEKK